MNFFDRFFENPTFWFKISKVRERSVVDLLFLLVQIGQSHLLVWLIEIEWMRLVKDFQTSGCDWLTLQRTVVGYTYWSVSQSHPVHWESSTNHIHSISINQTSGCDWPICELTTTKLPRSLAYFNILNRNVGYWKRDQKSLLKHHRRPKLTSREKANDEFMNASRVVWLGVKLREEPLKFWTRYKEYYGERNMVDLQR